MMNVNEFLLEDYLDGRYEGSSGCAVIVENCIVRGIDGPVVRTIERGSLIQVWSLYDDVRFSLISDHNGKVEETCLLCKIKDIALIPKCIWGAFFPLSPLVRIDIARNKSLVSHLESIDIGSEVSVLHNDRKIRVTISWKNAVPKLPFGYYYGIAPLECDSYDDLITLPNVVTLDKLLPLGYSKQHFSTDGNISSLGITKSLSHNTLRPDNAILPNRHSSGSLDSTTSYCKLRDSTTLNSGIVQRSKGYHPSRSFDSSQSTCKKLARGRASTSLDSATSFSRENDEIDIGSLVEINTPDEKLYGVVQWVGYLPENRELRVAGIEMEDEFEKACDTRGLFQCAPYKAQFVPLQSCRRDTRFLESTRKRAAPSNSSFGLIDCPVVKGTIPPITEDLKNICGKNRGIQGHHNSCYLDSTLFAMFAFTSVFDSLLYRPRSKSDIVEYEEVQSVLRDEIVNPLRSSLYVRADRVMKLRTQLEQLSSVSGLTSEEKDPEEFLNSLLAQILKAQPFLQLSSGQDAFHYQLFVEKDERLLVPTVQQLFEQSFVASDIKLKQLPPCLIVQMPRFGKAFKMYPCIIPPIELDVTDVIENSPRQCTVCGSLAEMECRECYLSGMEGCSFCRGCLETAHMRPSRGHHTPRPLLVPTEFRELQEHCAVPRLTMKLFAVVCIETSHYVAFLNTNQGWVFFDSMADRKGEQNGYNIPEIVACPDVQYWLSKEGAEKLAELPDERHLPELAKRLLCDAYMCMYQSPDVMMYK